MKTFFEIRESTLNELTAAEKKLINQMYDKKGNLTPMGKKVMDHGKANSKLTPQNKASDNARRKEYNAYQKSKRNEEVKLENENTMLKMKLINKMKKASPAAKKALEAPSRVDKKKESVEEGVAADQLAKMKFVSKGFATRPEAERHNDSLVGKKKASQKSYVYKHKDNKFYVLDMKEASLDEAKTDVYHKLMLKALGKTKLPKGHGNTSSVANNGDFVVADGGGRVIGRLKRGEFVLPSKNESVKETKSGKSLDEISVKDLANQVMMKSKADAARKNRFKKADGIKTDLDRLRKGLKKYDMRPIKAQTEEKDPALKRAGVSGFNKPKRTPGHKSSSHIVVTKVDGKAKTIRFGQQGASTAGDPKEGESDKMKAKRKSFKARHGKNIAKGKSSAAYWADKEKW